MRPVPDDDARPTEPGPTGHAAPTPERLAQVSDALSGVRSRIAAAATAAGRDPGAVTLVAVTKTRPASDVLALAALGVGDVGENKDQEARVKHAEVAAEPAEPGAGALDVVPLRWHLVGQLQSNKANSVARYAHAVHSLDRAKLVTALDRGVNRASSARERTAPGRLQVFVQVSLDGDPERGGAVAADVPALADAVATAAYLDLAGVMAVAPADWEPARAFADLAAVSEALRRDHPAAVSVSAGMSDDLEAAVAAGSTHVRVGSALLGRRPPLLS
ncbi:YggS family pyridoxal phosphate-dependent enzyme [Jatrophihabitans sp. YIM 134969]